jgi:hypothetical protein
MKYSVGLELFELFELSILILRTLYPIVIRVYFRTVISCSAQRQDDTASTENPHPLHII